jgi:hypothetical protein
VMVELVIPHIANPILRGTGSCSDPDRSDGAMWAE